MIKVEKVNCVCVDWKRGARTGYTQAVHNTRVVGAEIAFLIQGLSVNPCLGHILWVGGRERGRPAPRGTQGQPGDPWVEAEPESREPKKGLRYMKLQTSSLWGRPEDP